MKFTLILSALLLWVSVLFAQIGSDPMTFYSIGRDFQKEKKYEQAIEQFNQAILYDTKNEVKNHLFHYQKANCLMLLKKNEEAITTFEQTLAIKDTFFPAHTRLGKLYSQKKEYDKAIAAYDKAFEYEKKVEKRIKYKVKIIRLLERLERSSEVPKHIGDAKGLTTKNLNFLYFQAHYANQAKNYTEAKDAMEKATLILEGKAPKIVAKYYYELGIAYHHVGEHIKRDKAFEKANYGKFIPLVRMMKPSFYHKIAKSFLKIYEYDICREYIDISFDMQAHYQPAFETLKELDLLHGDKSMIIESIERSILAEKDAKKRVTLSGKLAKIQLEQGMFESAYQTSVDFLSYRPVNVDINFIKAVAQFKKGEILASIETLEVAVRTLKMTAEKKAECNFALGWFHKKNSDNDAAKKAFKRAMSGSFQYAAKREFDNL